MNSINDPLTKTNNDATNTEKTEFKSTKNPSAKITLEFSTEERNAQRDFIDNLKNLYINKLKYKTQNGD